METKQDRQGADGSKCFAPGGKLGVLGGGQLGRMLAQAAMRLGYRVNVLEPEADCPTAQVGARAIPAAYGDPAALRELAESSDCVTFEFENIPSAALEKIEALTEVRPGRAVLHVCQNREREKNFLRTNGFPCAEFRVVHSLAELEAALAEMAGPWVLKTADFGYDGKGQVKITDASRAAAAWESFGGERGVLERWIAFSAELSVVCARSVSGEIRAFPAAENIHRNHILDVSLVPGRFSAGILARADELARRLVEKLGVVGLLAVELFLTKDGELLVNELAPRPHNSGHYTLDATAVSQFEQHVRAICGLPLGSTELRSPAVMVNLLGDLWQDQTPPDWTPVFATPGASLHLYGKAQARPGRKMGHFNVCADSLDEAISRANQLRMQIGLPEF